MIHREVKTAIITGWMVTWHDGYHNKLVIFDKTEYKEAVKYHDYRYNHNPSRSNVNIIPIYQVVEE